MYYICQMSGTSAPENPPPPAAFFAGQHYANSLDNLRSTVKWLVGSAGAIAAAIIAGTQLIDYSNRNPAGAALAAVAVATALWLTLAFLIRAAKILTVPRPTAIDLSNAELRANALDARTRLEGKITDSDVQWVLSRASYLLGTYDTVTELLAAAHEQESDNTAGAITAEIRQRIDLVEQAAHYRDMSNAYGQLLKHFRSGSAAFIFAIIAFSVSGLLHKAAPTESPNRITTPVAVQVVTVDQNSKCPNRSGVAIDGTLSTPTVIVAPTGPCPAETIVPPRPDLAIIPDTGHK
ncbi:Uncharacterised protein [Mycobacteroides abscessus subsp. bolletii]|nr:Uncharacterised protein [Mycobacteroides abscessus subsp. bolletii]SKX37811.1 Uncharacterised protein [Mycobacteroides abscessus subsp. bolletii]